MSTKNTVKTAKTGKTAKGAEITKAAEIAKAEEKPVERSQEVYVQFSDKEVNMKAVLGRVEEIWTKDMDNKAEDLKDVKVYLKIEDNAAYFVVNGDITGSFGL